MNAWRWTNAKLVVECRKVEGADIFTDAPECQTQVRTYRALFEELTDRLRDLVDSGTVDNDDPSADDDNAPLFDTCDETEL